MMVEMIRDNDDFPTMRSYLDSYSQTMLRTYVARVLESDAVEERGGGPTESRRKEEAGGEGGGNGDADGELMELWVLRCLG